MGPHYQHKMLFLGSPGGDKRYSKKLQSRAAQALQQMLHLQAGRVILVLSQTLL